MSSARAQAAYDLSHLVAAVLHRSLVTYNETYLAIENFCMSTTRSGRHYKEMTETGGGETVTERLLRMLLDDQKQRDEENARREEGTCPTSTTDGATNDSNDELAGENQ